MHVLRRLLPLLSALLLFPFPSLAEEERIEPAWPVPRYVRLLLEVASEEVGYEEDRGRTKYGEWAGDPYCQWCAEFQCWCVDQVDQRYGTELLNKVYPRYSGTNTGRDWFINAGRYVIRKGPIEGWGYEWLKGSDTYIQSGDYIPQPGDWIFFTWTSNEDTDHVALVEYCTRDTETGDVKIHVIEGNKPSAVARDTYDLNYNRILGYGTVHDVADFTMQAGNSGEKVRQLQQKLAYLGYLDPANVTGGFGQSTARAVHQFQADHGLKTNGIANQSTQLLLDKEVERKQAQDPELWTVVDDGGDDDL